MGGPKPKFNARKIWPLENETYTLSSDLDVKYYPKYKLKNILHENAYPCNFKSNVKMRALISTLYPEVHDFDQIRNFEFLYESHPKIF